MTQTKKAKTELSDEARRDFNRRFSEVLAEGFEHDLIPADLHSAIADGIVELNSDYAKSFALEARLILPIALDRAQRAAVAETAVPPEQPVEEIPAWAKPLQESLLACLEDDRLPKEAREALGDGVMQFVKGYADMDIAGTVEQFFIRAIVNAYRESEVEHEESE